MTGVKKKMGTNSDTETQLKEDNGKRHKKKMITYKLREKSWNRLFPQTAQPYQPLLLDFWLLAVQDNTFLLFKPSYFVEL